MTKMDDMNYWCTILEENSETDGFYTDRLRKSLKEQREQQMLCMELQNVNFTEEILQEELYDRVISAISFVLSKNQRKNEIVLGIPGNLNNIENGQIVPLKLELVPENTLEQLQEQIKDVMKAVMHQEVPFTKAAEELNLKQTEYMPLFKTLIYNDSKAEAVVEAEHADISFYFDIGKNTLTCNYVIELYTEETIRQIFSQIAQCLQQSCKTKLCDLDVLSKEEHQRLKYMEGEYSSLPSDITFLDLLKKQVTRVPQKHAIEDGERFDSYQILDEKTNQIAHCLCEIYENRSGYVGIYMDNCLEQAEASIGIQKAGCAYIPIDEELPFERIKQIINDAGMKAVLSNEKNLNYLHKLQWECTGLKAIICMDSDNIYKIDTEKTEFMDDEFWELTGKVAEDEIEQGGWRDSYTGRPFSEEEMAEWRENTFQKLKPYLSKTARVLEIGCSSGISMFRIAPYVGFYYGTDLSGTILEKDRIRIEKEGYKNIHLKQCEAKQISEIEEKDFDIVIINSVAQLFRGYNYFRDVFRQIIGLVKESAYVFIGDIMDADLKQNFIESVEEYGRMNPGTNAHLKTDFSGELYYPKVFFEDLQCEFPQIKQLNFSNKIATIENELTKYRYDLLLQLNKTNLSKKDTKQKLQLGKSDLECYPKDAVNVKVTQDMLAYAIYTSGTTGRPKGVAISHEALLEFCLSQNKLFDVTEEDRMARCVRVGFDPSVLEFFPYLVVGATVVIVPNELRMDLNGVNRYFDNHQITIACLPTQFCEQFQNLENHSLRLLITGGDKLRVGKKMPYRLFNNYGPTENTIITTSFEVDQAYKSIPIGKPMGNTKVYIVDQYGREQPIGVPGELLIAGKRLSVGYINNETQTKLHYMDSCVFGERVYRSGDLAKWLPDGNLDFIGRIDKQIKISAFRIEIGEVEASIQELHGIEQVVVTVKEDRQKNRFLCAYYVTNEGILPKQIKTYLAGRLPSYMIPKYLLALPELPKTKNGKVNYESLPNPIETCEIELVMPGTDLEQKLWNLWCQVLEKENFGITDDFFQIGGNSIQIMRILSEWEQKEPLKYISFTDAILNPTIRAMAQIAEQNEEKNINRLQNPMIVPELNEAGRYEPFALSQLQQAYFVGRRNEMELGNVPTHCYSEFFCEDYDRERFLNAICKLVNRHDMLHARFLKDGRQFVLREYQVKVPEEDLSCLTDTDRKERLAQIRREMENMVRNCFEESLVTLRVSKIGENEAIIHVYYDGLIIDGWSQEILFHDIDFYYEHPDEELPAVPIHFCDYIQFLEKLKETEKYKNSREYWLKRISSLSEAPILPINQQETSINHITIKKYSESISRKEWEQIKIFSKKFGISSFVVLLTVFGQVIGKWGKRKNFCINVPEFNRTAAKGMADEVVGECASFLLFNMEQTKESFLEIVKKNQLHLAELMEHDSFTGMDVLREISREQGSVGNYSTPIVFTSLLDIPSKEMQHFKKVYVQTHTSQVWIDAVVQYCNECVEFSWDCVDSLFEPGVLNKMIHTFTKRIRQLAKSEEAWWEENDYQVPEEEKIIRTLNETDMVLPMSTLDELLIKSREQYGTCTAVIQGNRIYSYEEFFVLTDRFLERIQNLGVNAGDVVAIVMDKRVEQLAAVIAAVLAGAIYLPIDVQLTKERISYCILEAESKMVIYDSDEEEKLLELPEQVLRFNVDEPWERYGDVKMSIKKRTLDDVFCIIYTSGSTGKPKGVLVPQRGLINAIVYTNLYYKVSSKDSVLALTNLSHDMSMYDIFGMFQCGGCIILPETKEEKNPKHWLEVINKYHVTIWNSAPAFMEMMLEVMYHESGISIKNLRLAIMGGDVMRKMIPQCLWKENPQMVVVNVGGPTETTLWNIHHIVTKEDLYRKRIPYGRPMANTKYFILNEAMQICPIYAEGIMYVEGAGVTKGYLKDPEKSAQKYMINPYTGNRMYCTGDVGRYLEDGTIDIIGRDDFQIKINGKRIELEEIEQAAYENPQIQFAAAVLQEAEHAIALYIKVSGKVSKQEVRESLAKILPHYMMPKYLVMIEDIPLSRNGKVNKKALPMIAIEKEETQIAQAATETESALIVLYNKIIGITSTTPKDNFFSLGGDSLKAIKLLYEVNAQFHQNLSLTDIFNHPSVSELAGYLESRSKEDIERSVIEKCRDLSRIHLSFAQEGIWFVQHSMEEDADQRYNLVGSIRISAMLNIPLFIQAVELVVKNCQGIRVEIYEEEYLPYQRIVEQEKLNLICENCEMMNADDVLNMFEKEELRRKYKLDQAPLYHFRLGQTKDKDYIFTMGIHHIIADAYSVHLLLQQIKETYYELMTGTYISEQKEEITFQDFLTWQRREFDHKAFDSDITYWKKKLQGPLNRIELSENIETTWSNFEGGVYTLDICNEDVLKLKGICQQLGMTVFSGFTTIFYLFLAYLCDTNDICIGTAASGRTRSEIKNAIGNFANVLLLRTKVEPEDSFCTLAEKVKETIEGAYAHQSLPFEKIVQEAHLNYEVFDLPYKIIIDYVDLEDNQENTEFGKFEYTHQLSPADLDFFIQSLNEQFQFQFYYKVNLFTLEEIEDLGDLMQDILQQVLKDPDMPLDGFEL